MKTRPMSKDDTAIRDAGYYQINVRGEDTFQTLNASVGGDQVLLVLVADGFGGKQAAHHVAQFLLPAIAQQAVDGSAAALL